MGITKACVKCGEVKDTFDFSKQSSTKDGLKNQCKACDKEYARRYYEKNKQEIKERTSQYSKSRRETYREYERKSYLKHREKNLERRKSYRDSHQDEDRQYRADRYVKMGSVLRQRSKDWNARNPMKMRAAAKRWRDSHPDDVATLRRARRAKVANAEGKHTAADIRRLYVVQEGRCVYCKTDLKESKYDVDHIMPIALGGSNSPENLQLLCPRCNRSKGAMHPEDFMRKRGFAFTGA